MAHLALYRKYRPQSFGELVGQADTARVLKNAVKSGRTTHAYLFCGTRGTGKTSTARILAKALNCHNPQDGEPCNACSSCFDVMEGRSLDVIEIDAASNRGIDEARDLLEKVHFIPNEGRYKIYIIDEVHMLTNDAFNALLKTFEEPPSHVVFILATTESRKVPLTILSRCQRYDFKAIGQEDIASNLRRIADAETLTVDADAIELLAAKAKGSMRDALSLLDQVSDDGEARITVAAVINLLGAVESDFWPQFFQNIAAREAEALFQTVIDLEQRGKDVRSFFQDFQELLGDIIAGSSSGYYGEIAATCRGIFSDAELMDMLTIVGEGESNFRYNKDARMVYRFLMAKILRALDRVAPAQAHLAPERATAKPTFKPNVAAAAELKAMEDAVIPPMKEAPAAPKRDFTPPPLEDDGNDYDAFQSKFFLAVRKKAPKTYTWLSAARVTDINDNSVTITYDKATSPHYQHIITEEHMAILREVLRDVQGRETAVKISAAPPTAIQESSLFD